MRVWVMAMACAAGLAACGSSSDVDEVEDFRARLAEAGGPPGRTHLSGCERRCGAPVAEHLDLVAPTAAEVDALAGAVRG